MKEKRTIYDILGLDADQAAYSSFLNSIAATRPIQHPSEACIAVDIVTDMIDLVQNLLRNTGDTLSKKQCTMISEILHAANMINLRIGEWERVREKKDSRDPSVGIGHKGTKVH